MKKKTFGLITSAKSNYSLQRILEEAKSLKFRPVVLNVKDLVYMLHTNYPCDFVINRSTGLAFDDLDMALLRQFEGQKTTCHNGSFAFEHLRNKDRQLIELKNQNFNPPPSIFLRGAIDEKILIPLLNNWREHNDFEQYAYILKTQRGNKGIGVNLIRGNDSLFSILETFWGIGDQRFILQPYIPHKREYRLFVIKGAEPIFIEKTKSQDFRSNAARSKTTYLRTFKEKPFKQMLEVANKAMDAFHLSYAGFDFFEANSGEIYLCEINPVPGFENIEKLTGKNIARELLLKF